MLDPVWASFQTELLLGALALGALIMDMVTSDDAKRGRRLAGVAMAGVAVILALRLFWRGPAASAFSGSLTHDGIATYFEVLFLMGGFLALFMAREYQAHLKRGHSEFVLLILLSLVGVTVLASADDFLLFFVSLEILTVSLYVMTAYLREKPASIEAGVKYLVLGALSTAVFLYGFSFVYGSTGSTSYTEIAARLAAMPKVPEAFLFGAALVVASLAFKIAAVPFQLWAPDVYEGAPTPVTAYLAIASKAAGFAALLRLSLTVFAPAWTQISLLLAVLAALTILYGNLGAIPQTNIKRLLAYSSIGHAGYMLIGLAALGSEGGAALLYYLLGYLFSTGGAFLVLIALAGHMKTDDIRELAGLSKRSPLLAAGMMLALLSLAGLPPLAGFFAKFYLLWCGVKAGLLWLVVIGVLNVVTSLYYYLKVVKVMYVDKPVDESLIHPSLGQRIMQYLSIAGILILGIFQGPFVRMVLAAFRG